MPFNINTFKSEITTNGVIPVNKYEVYLSPPATMSGFTSGDGQINTDIANQLRMRCDDVNIPSVSLTSLDVNRYGYGIPSKMPFNANFNVVNLSFICDGYGSIWKFWFMWLKSIFNFAGVDNGNGTIFNSSGNYLLDYKDNYSTVLSVITYDNYGDSVQTNDYSEFFPIGINDIRYNWNMDNQFLKIIVAAAFTEPNIAGATLGGTNNN